MNNLVEKCDLCSGWGLIAKQNNSHIQCPRCQGDALKKELDELEKTQTKKPLHEKTFTELTLGNPGFGASVTVDPSVYTTTDGLVVDTLLLETLTPFQDAPPRKRGRPRKEK